MPQSYEAGLPPMILTDDFKIAFEARDASGAAVSGVIIANPHFLAESDEPFTFEQVGPFLFTPGGGERGA